MRMFLILQYVLMCLDGQASAQNLFNVQLDRAL